LITHPDQIGSFLSIYYEANYSSNSYSKFKVFEYQNEKTKISRYFEETIYSFDYDLKAEMFYSLSDSNFQTVNMIDNKMEVFPLTQSIITRLEEFKTSYQRMLTNKGVGTSASLKLFNQYLVLMDNNSVSVINLLTGMETKVLNQNIKLSVIDSKNNKLYLYDGVSLYSFDQNLELLHKTKVIDELTVGNLNVNELTGDLILVQYKDKIVKSSIGANYFYENKVLPMVLSFFDSELRLLNTINNKNIPSKGWENASFRTVNPDFIWLGDKLVYSFNDELFLIRDQLKFSNAFDRQYEFIANMSANAYKASEYDFDPEIYDNLFIDFKPVTPEEIFKRVRKDKQFGQIRDFTPEEKEKYDI
jgi:hypothetical protein